CTAVPAAAAMTGLGSDGSLPVHGVNPGTEVFHVTPRPFWVIPRYLPLAASNSGGGAPPFVPLDVFFHRWSERMAAGLGPDEQTFPTGEDHTKSNALFADLCGDQGKLLSPVLAVPRVTSEPVVAAISDSYSPLVASGHLKLCRGRLTRVSESSLELSDENAASVASAGSGSGSSSGNSPSQSLHGVDAIVLCTGLRPALTFLSDDLLNKLSYTPYDNYVPLALHRRVLHPDAPGLAFVGLYRSPFFAVVELQGRLAAAAFTGALPAAEADLAAQRAGVAMELRVRQHTPRTPYPHQDYVGHADGLAAAMGLLPPPGWRTEHDVVMAAHYAGATPVPKPQQPPAAALPGRLGPAAGMAAGAASTAAVATVDGQQGDVAVAPAMAEWLRTEVQAAAVGTVAVTNAVRQALDDVKAAMGEYRIGRRVASAVFYALAGEWALRRQIVSRLPSSPSGEVTGRARFTTISEADFAPAVGGAGGLSYLYDEQGQFAIQGGAVMRVRREYVYTYDSTADRVDVYFTDVGLRRGEFFHSLRFLPPEPPQNGDGGGGCWRAVGDHLCVRDMYDASYRFSFQGFQLREFEIEFQVKGPKKDYTATATYTRP
ncbi:hypothetical protein VaNZ11_005853, partial [Volvox africanus]